VNGRKKSLRAEVRPDFLGQRGIAVFLKRASNALCLVPNCSRMLLALPSIRSACVCSGLLNGLSRSSGRIPTLFFGQLVPLSAAINIVRSTWSTSRRTRWSNSHGRETWSCEEELGSGTGPRTPDPHATKGVRVLSGSATVREVSEPAAEGLGSSSCSRPSP